MDRATRAKVVLQKLRESYPDAHCELNHDGPFQLLVSPHNAPMSASTW
jgi:endonuclease III